MRDPNHVLVVQDGQDAREAKMFRTHAPQHGACETLECALKSVANMPASGHKPVDTIFRGFAGAEQAEDHE